MKTRPLFLLGVVAAIPLVSSTAAAAGDEDAPARCVTIRNIDHTVVVDDQNVLFYMLGDQIYQNRLRHPVPRLKENQPFMYRTSSSQLCRSDTITVLERWGFGYTEGASGVLGDFMPIDAEEALALRQQ